MVVYLKACRIIIGLIGCLVVVTTNATEVSVIAGLPKPPFIMQENGTGLQLDIMRHALQKLGATAHFHHVPNGRNYTTFQGLNADVMLTVQPDEKYPTLYVSQPYIAYQNVVISLKESRFNITHVDDLTNKVVVAFQNAKKYLGEEYAKSIDYVIDYREIPDQFKQVEMLFLRRTELIVIDINIFKYIIKDLEQTLTLRPYTVHEIFNAQGFSAAFRSKELRDKFDSAIEQMRQSGEYQRIVEQYIN